MVEASKKRWTDHNRAKVRIPLPDKSVNAALSTREKSNVEASKKIVGAASSDPSRLFLPQDIVSLPYLPIPRQ